jgi:formiminoglutamase
MNMREWLAAGSRASADVVVLGAPISKASITPSQAWATPAAFREALARFPTWDAGLSADVAAVAIRDAGDVEGDRDDVDATVAHRRIESGVATAAASGGLVVVVGGDNSLTRPGLAGMGGLIEGATPGLPTLDAHHDCRPVTNGSANGTPVRELIEGGLPGERVAQVGIHPLGNARDHARWAIAQGVHVHDVAAAVDLCEVDALADVAGITVRLTAATFTALCAGVALRVGHGHGR